MSISDNELLFMPQSVVKGEITQSAIFVEVPTKVIKYRSYNE